MKCIIVAGPLSSGKTVVINRLFGARPAWAHKPHFVKIDCAPSLERVCGPDGEIPSRHLMCGKFCPDHFFIDIFRKIYDDAISTGADCLLIETAGLCARCSPFFDGIPAVAVLPLLAGRNTPLKSGPIVSCADVVVLTGADLVSAAETRVFRSVVKTVNPTARLIAANALTGEGLFALVPALEAVMEKTSSCEPGEFFSLRHSPPKFVCSFCFGRRDISSFRS
jgi:Ni2+-binding GTPase involved in maturation of urease and hydrogenase